ncbi:hypothetical protein QN277_024322 [Acacia crassicarpa]|uniref:Phytocyanin domain-containing protein n=1 Tax=Acacia crassicarpa TaxID=499986 RepID=A0AAE1JBZ4_9FABA|nr:hypothetical protein QN277_024322 [Acacia crassicarpa]
MAKTWYYYSAAVAFLFLHCAASQTMHFVGDATGQTVHLVGDDTRWGVPPRPDFYSNWASSKISYPGEAAADLVKGAASVAKKAGHMGSAASPALAAGSFLITLSFVLGNLVL